MKITVLDNVYLDYQQRDFSVFGKVIHYTRLEREFKHDDEELIRRIGDSDIVVTCDVYLNRTVIEACSNLKYITSTSTGVDNIDLDAAKDQGILVSNLPSYGTMSVAQNAVALLLEVTNQISKYHNYVKENKWGDGVDWTILDEDLIELDNKVVGIIGYGKIGQATGKILEQFGCKIVTHDRDDSLENLHNLYNVCDIIILHCPLTKDNKYMINKDSITLMKDNVIIINNARGALVNCDDLYDALKSRRVYYAAFDVIDKEPVSSDHKLLSLNNFILTPHIAWGTIEARTRIIDLVYANIEQFINGTPINIVNY